MMKGLGGGVLIAWASLGAKIEKVVDDKQPAEIYISVPEHNYNVDEEGTELSGDALAKRLKDLLYILGVKNVMLKYRVRVGEYWTKEMDDAVQEDMAKQV